MKSPEERLKTFVDQVHATGIVWLLQADEGLFAMVEDHESNSYLVVWPDKEECGKAASGDWTDYTVEPMEIKEFLSWLYELEEDGVKLGIYPDEKGSILPFNVADARKLFPKNLS